MKATTIGFDLAKNEFQVHGVDAAGKPVIRKQLRRAQVLPFFARLAPCTIGIEACGSAHHWARKLIALGHTAKLIAPQFVKPYVKANKTDAADAEAICEAVARPNMRFVPVKSVEQQAILAVHRVRSGLVAERTAQLNRLRALLAEFGLIAPRGRRALLERLALLLADETLPGVARELFERQSTRVRELEAQISAEEAVILAWHRNNELSKRIDAVGGVGPITATALVASFGEGREFGSGRQMAACLGLVPRQHSSGGKTRLLGISKRGDPYLRMLLIHGARAVIRTLERRAKAGSNPTERWLAKLLARRNPNVAAVALANKTVRVIWALLAHDRIYDRNWVGQGTASAG
jgi:transposase